MKPFVWVPIQAIFIVHDRQIARHGGAAGLRDATLLEAACDRPRNKLEYDQADVFQCAAAYGFGICKAHAFVDGNKRTAFVTTAMFLRLNGWSLQPDPTIGVRTMENLATGEMTEEQFSNWLSLAAQKLT